MIGVMFTFPASMANLKTVYMFDETIHGVKRNGIRPIEAFIFEVANMNNWDKDGNVIELTEKEKESYREMVHYRISYALHPQKGKIVYQSDKLRDLFSL